MLPEAPGNGASLSTRCASTSAAGPAFTSSVEPVIT
jgi:hypothetical protein